MTDLEITLLCAKAVGLKPAPRYKSDKESLWSNKEVHRAVWTGMMQNEEGSPVHIPDPLKSDSDMVVLIKKYHPFIGYVGAEEASVWTVTIDIIKNFEIVEAQSPDLNRAVSQCIANMMKESSDEQRGTDDRTL